MEIVLFVGIQASGKSSFYKERFFGSHVRVSRDLVKTKNREIRLASLCMELGQPLVIDNTNPTTADRSRFIVPAKAAGFKVTGYYFSSSVRECLERNSLRMGEECIPELGVRGTAARMELPRYEEGFDNLYFVRILENEFNVSDWIEENEAQ